MKFPRTVLIDQVKKEIARREQRAVERTAEAAAKREEQLAAHLEKTTPAWGALADTIRVRRRYGKPVTAEDIPAALRGRNSSSGYVDVWTEPRAETYTADTGPLAALLTLLEATDDPEVTTTSIERLGFRTADLFRARS